MLRQQLDSLSRQGAGHGDLRSHVRNLVKFVVARPPDDRHLTIIGAEESHDTEIAIRTISLVLTQKEFKDRPEAQSWNLYYA